MKKINILLCGFTIAFGGISCQGGKISKNANDGDTLAMRYAQLLTIVKHSGTGSSDVHVEVVSEDAHSSILPEDGYAEVMIGNPWKRGTVLHRYILVPKGKVGDATVAKLAEQRVASEARCVTDTVRTVHLAPLPADV